jgi:hypothetical protein
MSRQSLVRFNVGGRDPLTPFGVKTGGSFTVPDSKTVASAVGTDVGGTNLGSVVPTVGGQMLLAQSDAASGTACVFDLTKEDVCDLRPGDVVALSADDTPSAGFQTLTVTSVDGAVRSYVFATTTAATAVGYYA